MTEPVRCLPSKSVLTGWDFSTGAVKCLAFDLDGNVLAEVRFPTDLWNGDPYDQRISELNLMQLEGQARASVRAIASRLKRLKRLDDWVAGGISATHHTAGRIDKDRVQVRRAICWNDATLAEYRERGEKRLGGPKRVQELIGGPWADRYTLSHLVKDEDSLTDSDARKYLSPDDWKRTDRILPHGALAAGFLTGNFDVISVSAAASTGIMDLRRKRWCAGMLDALATEEYRKLARKQLPRIVDHNEPVGLLADHVAIEAGIPLKKRPLVFPTSDDQQAGLVGGGAVDDGQMAIILGNSAVVNSSSAQLPTRGKLDVMRLNWGPFLWMRCFSNGAQFLDEIVGQHPDWVKLEQQARRVSPGSDGTLVMPFTRPEPSMKINQPTGPVWYPEKPRSPGKRFRAALEAIAFLIAHGVDEHQRAGQKISRITVSGGIAKSELMCEILSTVINRPLERLVSNEGPALGAAVTALASMESHLRKKRRIKGPFGVADAVHALVKYAKPVQPNSAWSDTYRQQRRAFEQRLKQLQTKKRPTGRR